VACGKVVGGTCAEIEKQGKYVHPLERLLLPAPSECPVELNESLEFIQAGLCNTQFGREIVGFIRQHFQVVVSPAR